MKRLKMTTVNNPKSILQLETWANFYRQLNGSWHKQALWVFMLIVFAHWAEHVAQIYQIYMLGWTPKQAGGALGLILPQLVESEILHTGYNLLLWGGIFLLRGGFSGAGAFWWRLAILAQSIHLAEHLLLQVQYSTGYYLFGAAHQISIGQLWLPRPELHFLYNLIVFVPLMLGMVFRFGPYGKEVLPETRRS